MTALTRALLIAATFLMVAISVVASAAASYALGAKLVPLEKCAIGGHDCGALVLNGLGIVLALVKCIVPALWAQQQFTRRQAAVAFIIWAFCSAYLCTAVVGFGIGLVVRVDASEREVALFVGLWLVIEIAAGLLPAVVWPAKDVATSVTMLHQPLEFRKESDATLPLPAIITQPPRRDLLGLLRWLAAGAAEHGVQVAPDGCLVTTQRRLAALAGMAPSQAHDELYRLKDEGTIDLTTSARQTVIRLRS